MLELREMTEADLPRVAPWLTEPHVARWWLDGITAQEELDGYAARLAGRDDPATQLLLVQEDGRPIGWCQWYPYDAYPAEARAIGALPGECGIDYAIGDPGASGRGLGTAMIAALVAEVRAHHPGCGIIVDPDACNRGSRRVLERNGFTLVAEHPVATEPSDAAMAIYRLPGA